MYDAAAKLHFRRTTGQSQVRSNYVQIMRRRKQLTDRSFVNSDKASCQMALTFANPDYLPILWTAEPHNCSDTYQAVLTVPESAPSGLASIQWYH